MVCVGFTPSLCVPSICFTQPIAAVHTTRHKAQGTREGASPGRNLKIFWSGLTNKMRVFPLFFFLFADTKTTITRTTTTAAAAAFLSTQSFTNYHPISTLGSQENHFIHLIHASKTTQQLKQIHAQLYLHNLTQNSRLVTQLIPSYSSFKSINCALSTFHHFLDPNPFVFNALIRSLSENSQFENSIFYLILMLRFSVQPNQLTFPFAVKSAASLFAIGLGRCLHGDVIKFGLEFDSFVRVSLVDMYVKLGFLSYALQMFDETPERNKLGSILLWNVLINGCCRAGDLKKANELFETMPERNSGSWNSLINGFFREGDKKQARLLFEQMPEKNVVSWTTMVAGFTQNGDHQQALDMFFRMLDVGVKPNDLTIVSALAACARIGALAAGVWIHNHISHNKFKVNRALGTALVDMYAKCGRIECADRIFHEMKEKDLLTWSVMISGWATHGCSDQAFHCFEEMIAKGFEPDAVVFLAILTACSHSGLVDRGLDFFNSMRVCYSIEPTVKHYTCMVDLFGRAGQLPEALIFIKSMPIDPDFVIWGALFCACRSHKNIEMAELASERLLQLEPKHPGSYIFLSNIYAGVGRWEDVERVRLAMKSKGIEKPPGWSYIEVEGKVHSFIAGDRTHEHAEEIYAKLEELMVGARTQGYVPDTEWVLHNIEEEEKEDSLGSHSEKLALAFGLINTPHGSAIRIVKNLRVCGDCHSIMKYASIMSRREIIIRDIKRFHRFKDGKCTCGDYW